MNSNFNKNRIAKNTILLYMRMVFTIFINLYATRLTLQNLGVEDLGIYGVVGSLVTFCTILNNGLLSAIQRFIAFETGRKDGNVNRVFCSSLNIILIMSLVTIILVETIGIWVLYHYLNIPPEKLSVAFWVLQFSLGVCVTTLLSIPYNALIIANEKMDVFAIISILQVIINCTCAYVLSLLCGSRLFYYALLMMSGSVFIWFLYQRYCTNHFKEAHYHFGIDKDSIKQIATFAGVTSFAGIMQVASIQGLVFIMNIYFGVAVNAVYTIANQVKQSLISFSYNIYKAISPQITKTYANKEYEHYTQLVYSGSKAEVLMNYFVMIPLLFKAKYILSLWLGEVPDYLVDFTRIILFSNLAYASIAPFYDAVFATNKIAKFQIIPEIVYVLVLPLCYLLNAVFKNPIYMMLSIVAFDILICAIRMWISCEVTILGKSETFKKVVVPSVVVGFISCAVCYVITFLFPDENLISLLVILLLNSIFLIAVIFLIGLNKNEKFLVLQIAKKMYGRVW